MKKLNYLLCLIATFGGVYYGIFKFVDGNYYRLLIRLSIIPVILLPYIVQYFFKLKLDLVIVTSYIMFIFFAHFLGSIVDLYRVIEGYDKVMHFISGIFSSVIAYMYLIKNNIKHSSLFMTIFVLATTTLGAFLWELFEFTGDYLFNRDAQNVLTTGVSDTMFDMLLALLGAVVVILFYVYKKKRNPQY